MIYIYRMYRKIVNPENGNMVNVDSDMGRGIITNYFRVLMGGSSADDLERQEAKEANAARIAAAEDSAARMAAARQQVADQEAAERQAAIQLMEAEAAKASARAAKAHRLKRSNWRKQVIKSKKNASQILLMGDMKLASEILKNPIAQGVNERGDLAEEFIPRDGTYEPIMTVQSLQEWITRAEVDGAKAVTKLIEDIYDEQFDTGKLNKLIYERGVATEAAGVATEAAATAALLEAFRVELIVDEALQMAEDNLTRRREEEERVLALEKQHAEARERAEATAAAAAEAHILTAKSSDDAVGVARRWEAAAFASAEEAAADLDSMQRRLENQARLDRIPDSRSWFPGWAVTKHLYHYMARRFFGKHWGLVNRAIIKHYEKEGGCDVGGFWPTDKLLVSGWEVKLSKDIMTKMEPTINKRQGPGNLHCAICGCHSDGDLGEWDGDPAWDYSGCISLAKIHAMYQAHVVAKRNELGAILTSAHALDITLPDPTESTRNSEKWKNFIHSISRGKNKKMRQDKKVKADDRALRERHRKEDAQDARRAATQEREEARNRARNARLLHTSSRTANPTPIRTAKKRPASKPAKSTWSFFGSTAAPVAAAAPGESTPRRTRHRANKNPAKQQMRQGWGPKCDRKKGLTAGKDARALCKVHAKKTNELQCYYKPVNLKGLDGETLDRQAELKRSNGGIGGVCCPTSAISDSMSKKEKANVRLDARCGPSK